MSTELDYSPLEEYMAMLIAKQIDEKVSKNVQPAMATAVELQNQLVADMRIVLNKMVRTGVLRFNKNLNDIMFEFTPPK